MERQTSPTLSTPANSKTFMIEEREDKEKQSSPPPLVDSELTSCGQSIILERSLTNMSLETNVNSSIDWIQTEDQGTLMKPVQPTEEIHEKIEGSEGPSKVVDLKTPYKKKPRPFDNEELLGLTKSKEGRKPLHLTVNTGEGRTESRHYVAVLNTNSKSDQDSENDE